MVTANPANGASQEKTGYRFNVDTTNSTNPLDWWGAQIEMDFKVQKMDGTAIAVNDHNGIVNGSHSFIKRLQINMERKELYTCDHVDHSVNIKNLLEYDPAYAESGATNEFYYLDTSRHAEENQFTTRQVTQRRNAENNADEARAMIDAVDADYNKGFAARKALLGTSSIVYTQISLNRYSLFEALRDELLPSGTMELVIDLEDDNTLIWQAGHNCRAIVTRFELVVPRIHFNGEGQAFYKANYLKPKKWTYLREYITVSGATQQGSDTFRIANTLRRPRHVFVFIINETENPQQANPFLYNTFSVSTDPQKLTSCYLELENGIEYAQVRYTPNTKIVRVYNDVQRYLHKNSNHYEGTLLNLSNFKSLFPFVYFDLTKQEAALKQGSTNSRFHYDLEGGTAGNLRFNLA